MNNRNRTKILVTGATGFLGGYLGRRMYEAGLDFAVFARSKKKAEWFSKKGIEVNYGDILNYRDCRQALIGKGGVLHLAAATDVSDPELNCKINIDGLKNLISACQDNHANRFIFLSSNCAAREHRDAYGETKLQGESILKQAGLAATIFRPTMIYGKGSKEFDTFVKVIKYSPVVPLIGSGEYIIQPVYIGDAVEVLIQSLTNPLSVGKTYDLAGATPISFNDLVRLIEASLGLHRRPIVHLPPGLCLLGAELLGRVLTHVPISVDQVMAFIQNTRADLEPLRRDFNFTPLPLSKGLQMTFA